MNFLTTPGFILIAVMSLVQLPEVKETVPPVDECGTIHTAVMEQPKYKNGNDDLLKFLSKEVIPIVGKHDRKNGLMTTKVLMDLVIDKKGKVIDATFPNNELTELCSQEMKKKLFAMTAWTAGKIDGQPVCSHVVIPVSCIKWAN